MRHSDRAMYEIHARSREHQRRIGEARRELERVRGKRLVVGSSWGKDSVALVDLAVRTLGPVDVVHLKSPYELPGYESVLEWARGLGCTIHTAPTRKTLDGYLAWLDRVGLGFDWITGDAGKRSKIDELTEWITARGYEARATGVRAEESRQRAKHFAARGLTYTLTSGIVVTNPIGRWTGRDVWAYTVARELPWHPLYDCETHGLTRERLRNAGWLTFHRSADSRASWLRQHYPEQWSIVVERWPHVRGRS